MTDMDMKDTPKITITATPTEGFGAVKKYLNANIHCSDQSGSVASFHIGTAIDLGELERSPELFTDTPQQ